jgi:hypothetical protein
MDHPRIARILIAFALAIALTLLAPIVTAQTPTDTSKVANSGAIKLFVDSPVDDDYLKTEISFVDFVRDRTLADVYILVSSLNTASGGKEYTVTFQGRQRFEGMADTLRYVTKESDTEDMLRSGLVQTMTRGLVRYVSRTALAAQLSVSFQQQTQAVPKVDKWKHWVFTIQANGYFNGEQGYRYRNLWGSVSGRRVTEKLKLNIAIYGSESKNRFWDDDSETKSASNSKSFEVEPIFALSDHWSWLAQAAGGSSTYSNRSSYLLGGLGVEYNIFPYSQSTRRQLRVEYDVTFRTIRYYRETIYYRTSENLWRENVSVGLKIIQPWGSSDTQIQVGHYLNDFDKNRLDIWSDVSLRVLQGLSLSLSGGYSKIRDQIGLPNGGASPEEVLLRRSELETSYSYWTSIGLSYAFGSIYSDIVNPRFGD